MSRFREEVARVLHGCVPMRQPVSSCRALWWPRVKKGIVIAAVRICIVRRDCPAAESAPVAGGRQGREAVARRAHGRARTLSGRGGMVSVRPGVQSPGGARLCTAGAGD